MTAEATGKGEGPWRSEFIVPIGAATPIFHDGGFVPTPKAVRTTSAADIVQSAADAIAQRATLRDKPAGERSMKRTVDAFNGLLGRPALTEQEGWLFMCVLKMARATAGKHHIDDYIDLAGYAGLAGECGELLQAANDGEEVMQFNRDYGERSAG